MRCLEWGIYMPGFNGPLLCLQLHAFNGKNVLNSKKEDNILGINVRSHLQIWLPSEMHQSPIVWFC